MVLLKKERTNSKSRSGLYEGVKQKPGWAQKYWKKRSAFGVVSNLNGKALKEREFTEGGLEARKGYNIVYSKLQGWSRIISIGSKKINLVVMT